jgi:UDPglucose 6-dehydrogenase
MITVLGLGFVGLTTGLGFAKKGFKTYGFDINPERISKLRNLEIPFHEPHLDEALADTIGDTFLLNDSLDTAINKSDIIFICVGTPSAPDGSADLTYLIGAINEILNVKDDTYKVIVIKSTVPPSTITTQIIPFLESKNVEVGKDLGIVSNPEFLREGYCWEDFMYPDRIVIGSEDERANILLGKIYEPFEAPVHFVTHNTSEFIKYLSNSLLSTLISFSNEMSMIADSIGKIDIPEAFKILHEDKRWFGSPAPMSSYVYPGCGYGGYCLPKDTLALHSIAKENGYDATILKSNLETNQKVKDFVIKKILESDMPKDTPIGILGLAFKGNSDDVRLAPSKDIIEKLIANGFTNIFAYDPKANESFSREYPQLNIHYCDSLEEILALSSDLVVLTVWSEFIEKKELINSRNVFDFRYIY